MCHKAKSKLVYQIWNENPLVEMKWEKKKKRAENIKHGDISLLQM